ncbi:MAG: T9SS type A sorting domain-containing protein [Ignavibacteriae bacterium]|nr:T9SS type A sorting domain-containing protein [Ignavibacteriota bacterium]
MKQVSFLFIIFVAVTIVAFPQSRVLVSPNDEVIPLKKGEGAFHVLENHGMKFTSSTYCPDVDYPGFGYWPPPTFRFGARHKDVLGQWFVAQYSGTIDTLFWYMNGSIGALDSTVFVRIFRSNITPMSGPGVRPGPYNPPCQPWGYYLNSNDLDNGITPFKDHATDTNWISTYFGDTASFDPLGEEIWGMGGFYTAIHQGINYIPLDILGYKPFVNKGDVFFVTIQINSWNQHVDDERTEFAANAFSSAPPEYQEYYPSRIWKFYEHDSDATNCSGFPQSQVPKGWVARGGFTGDTLDVAWYSWWYSMTSVGNRPPQIIASPLPENIFSQSDQCVTAEIFDCDSLGNMLDVEEAFISYSVNGIFVGTTNMTLGTSHIWSGCIPGVKEWNTVTWSIIARDSDSSVVTQPMGSYRVVSLYNDFSKIDTSNNCPTINISGTGNVISSESFFNSPNNDELTNPKDDGTAGPFPLGGVFNFYGQELRYAWVGVNGAIALSASPTETLDVNSAGYFSNFNFPGNIRTHDDLRDTALTGRMPPNFISPFWNDLIYGETMFGSQYGTISWDTIGCKFIVQWDSLHPFAQINDRFGDNSIFRVILDRCSGTIDFQYDNIGSEYLDTTALIGFQADTIPILNNKSPWCFINNNGQPIETRVRNGDCFTIQQKSSFTLGNGWNLVPIWTDTLDTNYSVQHLFPNATSLAFRFTKFGYERTDTVQPGVCYWIKINGNKTYHFPPDYSPCDTIRFLEGWNALSSNLATTIPVPFNHMFISMWYVFDNGYRASPSLEPYRCYFVRAVDSGAMELCSSSSLEKSEDITSHFNKLNKFTITDNANGEQTLYFGDEQDLKLRKSFFELPPVAPEGLFDARFSSNNMVETFSASKVNEEYTINIQSSSFPLTLTWDASVNQTKTMLLTDNSDGTLFRNVYLRGKGSVKITNPSVKQVTVRTLEGSSLPLEFALLQNYPNPFNPSTDFGFRISDFGLVTLKIYDVLGREVTMLVNEEKEPGEYTVQWDASNFPSGVYFYKLTAGKFSDVKKLLLVK